MRLEIARERFAGSLPETRIFTVTKMLFVQFANLKQSTSDGYADI
jgi:hypothetical protein